MCAQAVGDAQHRVQNDRGSGSWTGVTEYLDGLRAEADGAEEAELASPVADSEGASVGRVDEADGEHDEPWEGGEDESEQGATIDASRERKAKKLSNVNNPLPQAIQAALTGSMKKSRI